MRADSICGDMIKHMKPSIINDTPSTSDNEAEEILLSEEMILDTVLGNRIPEISISSEQKMC